MDNEKTGEKQDFSWDSIIEDAKIAKPLPIEWNGQKFTLFYKELLGPEDSEVDKKYKDDQADALSEKALLMLMKANTNASTDMTRERWITIPARLRNYIVFKLVAASLKSVSEDFRSSPEAKALSS